MWGKTEAAAETISVWEESVTERSRDRKVTRELFSEKSRKVTSVRSPKSKGDNPRKGKAEKDEKVSDSTESFLRVRVLREAICQKTRDTNEVLFGNIFSFCLLSTREHTTAYK